VNISRRMYTLSNKIDVISNGIPEFTIVYDRFRTILFGYPLHCSNTFANCRVLI